MATVLCFDGSPAADERVAKSVRDGDGALGEAAHEGKRRVSGPGEPARPVLVEAVIAEHDLDRRARNETRGEELHIRGAHRRQRDIGRDLLEEARKANH